MDTSSESYLTVRQHADALAHEAHPKKRRQHRNEPLDQLVRAIWLDQFGDETTPCLLLSPGDVKNHKRGFKQPPGRCPIRVVLWRLLPKGEFWVPSAVRAAREDEYLWQEIAALSWDDYDEHWRRHTIEPVVILEPGIGQWKALHWKGKPKTGGRKPGSGGYAVQDAPRVEEMKVLLASRTAKTLHAAACIVAPHAEGSRIEESKVKRLMKRYKELHGT